MHYMGTVWGVGAKGDNGVREKFSFRCLRLFPF